MDVMRRYIKVAMVEIYVIWFHKTSGYVRDASTERIIVFSQIILNAFSVRILKE